MNLSERRQWRDPFRIEGPACISFSGGRTSGYMLWRILQSHEWTLPADVAVVFANTGKEMLQTLDFVQVCSEAWNVPIMWLEYGRENVTHANASRSGEPYERMIDERRARAFLPNPVMRFCTQELKLDPIAKLMQARGLDHWTNVIGFRADEPRRLAKLNVRDSSYDSIAPLAEAGIGEAEVLKFWAANDFDLNLPATGYYSNCDLCFLKDGNQVLALIREKPSRADWWIAQEVKAQGTFRADRPSYTAMQKMARDHGELFPFADEALTDCFCTA